MTRRPRPFSGSIWLQIPVHGFAYFGSQWKKERRTEPAAFKGTAQTVASPREAVWSGGGREKLASGLRAASGRWILAAASDP